MLIRKKLIILFDKKMALQDDSTEENCKISLIRDFLKDEYTFYIEEFSPTLPLFIKKAESKNALSKYLFESDDTEYTIEGPFVFFFQNNFFRVKAQN